MKPIPKVGQMLYSVSMDQKLIPVIVTQAGRKYFKVSPNGEKGWQETQYHLEDWLEVTDYAPTTRLYETEQEYYDDAEKDKLIQYFYKFDEKVRKLSFETLKKIHLLVENEIGCKRDEKKP